MRPGLYVRPFAALTQAIEEGVERGIRNAVSRSAPAGWTDDHAVTFCTSIYESVLDSVTGYFAVIEPEEPRD